MGIEAAAFAYFPLCFALLYFAILLQLDR